MLGIFREVVDNKLASSLVVSLGKAFNGTTHLYVEDTFPGFSSEERIGSRKGDRPEKQMPCNTKYRLGTIYCGDP